MNIWKLHSYFFLIRIIIIFILLFIQLFLQFIIFLPTYYIPIIIIIIILTYNNFKRGLYLNRYNKYTSHFIIINEISDTTISPNVLYLNDFFVKNLSRDDIHKNCIIYFVLCIFKRKKSIYNSSYNLRVNKVDLKKFKNYIDSNDINISYLKQDLKEVKEYIDDERKKFSKYITSTFALITGIYISLSYLSDLSLKALKRSDVISQFLLNNELLVFFTLFLLFLSFYFILISNMVVNEFVPLNRIKKYIKDYEACCYKKIGFRIK